MPKTVRKSRRKSSAKPAQSFFAAVLTVSDSCARGEREDRSGPAVARLLAKSGFEVVAAQVVADEVEEIQQTLVSLCSAAQLVVSTGGTGIALRDVTPEATLAISERVLDGVAERIRLEGAKKTPLAVLSRGVCVVRGRSLILNLPGSPKGALESLRAVLGVLPHALNLLAGNTEHN